MNRFRRVAEFEWHGFGLGGVGIVVAIYGLTLGLLLALGVSQQAALNLVLLLIIPFGGVLIFGFVAGNRPSSATVVLSMPNDEALNRAEAQLNLLPGIVSIVRDSSKHVLTGLTDSSGWSHGERVEIRVLPAPGARASRIEITSTSSGGPNLSDMGKGRRNVRRIERGLKKAAGRAGQR